MGGGSGMNLGNFRSEDLGRASAVSGRGSGDRLNFFFFHFLFFFLFGFLGSLLQQRFSNLGQ